MALQLQLSQTKLTFVDSDTDSYDSFSENDYTTNDLYSDDVYSSSSSSLDSIPFTELLQKMLKTEEDIILSQNGYKYIDKLCDTLQGELIKAEVIKPSLRDASVGSYVAIKKTDKSLVKDNIAIQDNMTFMVSENCFKEAYTLKQLGRNSNIVQFIDYFESDTHFYLVMEYIENAITLKEFVDLSFKLINECELTMEEYSKTIQYIIWQLANTIRYLHGVVQCTHLDICCENIMLQNFEYIKCDDGSLIFNKDISITLIDFGVAELFEENEDESISYLCSKYGLSLDNEYFVAPQIYNNDIYDGRFADIWSLGMVIYQCIIGKALYEPCEMWDEYQCGYLALVNNKLKQYVSDNKLLKYFPDCSFSLLKNLLMIDENKRFDAYQVVKHSWFKSYKDSASCNKCTTKTMNVIDRSLLTTFVCV